MTKPIIIFVNDLTDDQVRIVEQIYNQPFTKDMAVYQMNKVKVFAFVKKVCLN